MHRPGQLLHFGREGRSRQLLRVGKELSRSRPSSLLPAHPDRQLSLPGPPRRPTVRRSTWSKRFFESASRFKKPYLFPWETGRRYRAQAPTVVPSNLLRMGTICRDLPGSGRGSITMMSTTNPPHPPRLRRTPSVPWPCHPVHRTSAGCHLLPPRKQRPWPHRRLRHQAP